MGKLKYMGKFVIKINANALSALLNANTLSNGNASSAIFKYDPGDLMRLINDHRTSHGPCGQDLKISDDAFAFDNVFVFDNADDAFCI